MQKFTLQQLDERVNVKIDDRIARAVPATVRTTLVYTIDPKAFKKVIL